MEKCTMCIQRIRRATRGGNEVEDQSFNPACVQSCPTDAMVFGDLNNSKTKVAQKWEDKRGYRVLEGLGTNPSVKYLKQVELDA